MKNHKYLVIGGTGLIGSSLCRHLKCEGTSRFPLADFYKLDATNENEVRQILEKTYPDIVINASGMINVKRSLIWP